jgi:phage baseplate assembly protein W
MTTPIYRGFSTANYLFNKNKTFSVTNQECVKQDLLNFIYTVIGERLYMPDFGTRIPLLTFEQLDENMVRIVREDITKAVKYDPRLELLDMSINALPDQNAIVAFVDVRYVELDAKETLKLEFNVG